MKTNLFCMGLVCLFAVSNGMAQTKKPTGPIVTNPINLSYRFYPKDDNPARREAADPVCEYFNGKYYLFASKSGGYWSSTDLANWTYIPCRSIDRIESYAPTILAIDNTLYYMGSGKPAKIYKTTNPDVDNWQSIDTKFNFPETGDTDPAFFRDDDGRIYIYWGCSDRDPIIGVEVDPNDGFKAIGKSVALIQHQSDIYGWETSGNNNDNNRDGWNEGPCMIKYKGKYYLQYAGPGTEFRVYGDGAYIGDSPLGPFTFMENSPFSFKPGGFIAGAGHGHTFLDKYGNYWHVASMKISIRHPFERRLGIFPLYITEDGQFRQHSVWADYPFVIPNEKTDFAKTDCSVGWNLLSHNKPAAASSSLEGFPPSYAFDEKVEDWWSAQTGRPGEWLQVDLKKNKEIQAIQVNWADQDFTIRAPHPLFNYQYIIEASSNGKDWVKIVNKTNNTQDAVHDLIVLDKAVKTRFLRITNSKELPGKFSLSGFRVFGNGKGKLPHEATGIKVQRNPDDNRRFSLSWDKQADTDGYIVNVGIVGQEISHSVMVYDTSYEGGFFNRDSQYYFTIDSFNENGVTKGKKSIK